MLWKAEREYPNFRVINPTKQSLSGPEIFIFGFKVMRSWRCRWWREERGNVRTRRSVCLSSDFSLCRSAQELLPLYPAQWTGESPVSWGSSRTLSSDHHHGEPLNNIVRLFLIPALWTSYNASSVYLFIRPGPGLMTGTRGRQFEWCRTIESEVRRDCGDHYSRHYKLSIEHQTSNTLRHRVNNIS